MRYIFRFLLANGGTEHHTFTATAFRDAATSAFTYSRSAFEPGELLDFFWVA